MIFGVIVVSRKGQSQYTTGSRINNRPLIIKSDILLD